MPRTATIKRLRPTPEFPLDTHPEVSLDFTRVKQHLSKHGYKRPVLIVDLALSSYPSGRYEEYQATVMRELFNRLPELGRGIGKGIKNFKDGIKDDDKS